MGKKNDSGSPFAAPVVMEKAKIARLGKPYKPEEVVQKVLDGIKYEDEKATPENATDILTQLEYGDTKSGKFRYVQWINIHQRAIDAFNAHKKFTLDKIEDADKRAKEETKLNAVKDRWDAIDRMMMPGKRIYLKTTNGNITGIVLKVENRGESKNPLSLSTWRVKFAIPDASREITIPYSRIFETAPADDAMAIEAAPVQNWIENAKQTLERFAHMQTDAKEDRYIATGNILAAYDWLNKRGQIINYTDDQGRVRQGIITARNFDLAQHGAQRGKPVSDPQQLKDWIAAHPDQALHSQDNVVRIVGDRYSRGFYTIHVTPSRRQGGQYYLNKELTDLVGDFYRRGGTMQAGFNDLDGKLVEVIRKIQDLGAKFTLPADFKTETVQDEGPGAGMAQKGLAATEGGQYPFTVRGKPEFRTDIPLGEQAQTFVMGRGRLTKSEHLVAFDANGAAISHLEGNEHRVGMSDDLKRALLDPNARIVVHHNHPDNSGLSIQDWGQFAYPGLHSAWAHGHEGAVSRGELTDETRGAIARMSPEQAWQKIFAVADHVDRRIHQLLSQEAMRRRLTPEQLDDYGPHLVNAILHAAGIVDYRSNIDLTDTPLARLGLGEKLNGIAINAQREFFGASLPSGMVRRAAAPLSHLAEVGELFARPEKLARQYAGQEADDRAHGISDEKEEVSGGAAVESTPSSKGPPGGFSMARPAWANPKHPASTSIRQKIADILGSDRLLTVKEKPPRLQRPGRAPGARRRGPRPQLGIQQPALAAAGQPAILRTQAPIPRQARLRVERVLRQAPQAAGAVHAPCWIKPGRGWRLPLCQARAGAESQRRPIASADKRLLQGDARSQRRRRFGHVDQRGQPHCVGI